MRSLTTVFGDDADILQETDFQILLLATLTGPLGAALLSPLLDTLTGPYGVSATRIGLLLSAYTAPAIVIIPFIGILTDRYGRKPLLVAGLVLFGVAGSLLPLTTSFQIAFGLRLLQGVGGAGIVPVIVTSLGDLYTGSREATAQGLRFSASGLTQAIFPVIAGVIVVIGWQYPILLYSMAIPIAVVVYLWFDEPIAEINQANKTTVDPENASDIYPHSGGLLEFMARPQVIAILLARAIPPFVYFSFLTYNSVIVIRLTGGTAQQAGALVAIASFLLAVGASQTGRITAVFPSRTIPLIAVNLCSGLGLALVVLARSVLIVGVGVAVLGASFGLLLSFYRSMITEITPERFRGRVVSISESLGRVGSTGAPVVIGVLIGVTSPTIGLESAVRWVSVGVGATGGIAGVLLVGIANQS